jgi:hypothetical protein
VLANAASLGTTTATSTLLKLLPYTHTWTQQQQSSSSSDMGLALLLHTQRTAAMLVQAVPCLSLPVMLLFDSMHVVQQMQEGTDDSLPFRMLYVGARYVNS